MTDNTNRIAGVAYFYANGDRYQLAGDLEYGVSTAARETLVGQDAVHGYSEKPKAGFIAGTFRDGGALSVRDFGDMTNVTITIELANGKTVSGANMWITDAPEVNTQDGTFKVRFEGFEVAEL